MKGSDERRKQIPVNILIITISADVTPQTSEISWSHFSIKPLEYNNLPAGGATVEDADRRSNLEKLRNKTHFRA